VCQRERQRDLEAERQIESMSETERIEKKETEYEEDTM